MTFLSKLSISLSMTAILSANYAAGHGYLTTPLTEFSDPNAMKTNFVATIDAFFPGKFNGNPQQNADNFARAFKAQTQFSSLRNMLESHGPTCGFSNPNASPKPIPQDSKIVWQNPDTNEGFVPSHTGPCEVWLNEKKVFYEDNCAGKFNSHPKASIPIDFSSCVGSCQLKFYWLALHEQKWQVYKNCIPLEGHADGSVPNGAPTDGPTQTPSMQPTEYPQTPAPTSEYPPTEYPAPTPSDDQDDDYEISCDDNEDAGTDTGAAYETSPPSYLRRV